MGTKATCDYRKRRSKTAVALVTWSGTPRKCCAMCVQDWIRVAQHKGKAVKIEPFSREADPPQRITT